MEFTIKKAVPEDAEEILHVLKMIGSETDNLTFGEEGLPTTVEEEREYLKYQQDSGSSAMFVAKVGDQIVGTCSYNGYPRARMAHRGSLAISLLRSEWGKGYGSKMMEEVIRFAREEAKAEIISLEVRSDNERAIHLYEKFGFKRIGTFPGFFKIEGEWIDFDLMNLYITEESRNKGWKQN